MALRGFDALTARKETVGEEFEVAEEDSYVDEPAPVRAPGAPALVPFNLDAGSDEPSPPQPPAPLIKSEVSGVTDEQWTDFVKAMRTAQTGAVSASNQLGAFEMRPRRLEDLGLMKNVHCERSPQGVLVWLGDWTPPLSQDRFLSSPRAQYLAFSASMQRYIAGLRDGSIKRPEGGVAKGTSVSGVLAILHRSGPKGFAQWNDPDKQFENTSSLLEAVNGIF